MTKPVLDLSAEKGWAFRITHRDNVRWILQHGLHCATAGVTDPHFVPIGNADLIGKRTAKPLPAPFVGCLGDYVPFYFTPLSPMLLNIITGRDGVVKRPKAEIVVLVTSVDRVKAASLDFAVSDRNAIYKAVQYSRTLETVPWPLLRMADFRYDSAHPDKMERYQAELLVHQHLPTSALAGIACQNDHVRQTVCDTAAEVGVDMNIRTVPHWFFP